MYVDVDVDVYVYVCLYVCMYVFVRAYEITKAGTYKVATRVSMHACVSLSASMYPYL